MPELKRPGTQLGLKGATIALKGREKPPEALPVDPETDRTRGEVESEEEMSEVLSGFKDRAARENQRNTDATDSEFWFCVCFQTREQKDEFLVKSGLMPMGDKYLDGLAVAEHLNIPIEAETPTMPKLKTDRTLRGLLIKK